MKTHFEEESTSLKMKAHFETVQRTLLDRFCPYYYYIHCLLWMAATAAAVALLALLLEAGAEYVDYPEFT